MKKIFTFISLCMIAFNAIHAEITWTLSDDGTLTISGTDMPDYYGNDDSPWYSKRDKIKKVVIKNGVTSIGNYAFYNCTNLTSITLPNSVTSIGGWAFYECNRLTSITLPNSVTNIGNAAFSFSGLTSINIPNSVTSIGNAAFSNCKGLISITIPNSVKSIGNNTFSYCQGLTSVIIPNSVTSIGYRAFIECSSLTSVTIPNTMTSIGEMAFYGCSGLTSINIPSSVTSIGNSAFGACSALTSINIPSSVTSIGSSTFSHCTSLTSITIPESVTSIGSGAFSHCSSLISISIPESVTSIDMQAFMHCKKITSITIPESVTSIKKNVFYGCSRLTSITIPNSVTSIGYGAFYYCSNLTSITIPSSVTSIGDFAFRYCSNLTSINIPSSVTSIGIETFHACINLASITVEQENIKYDSRDNCNAVIETESNTLIIGCKNTVIPNSVKRIGKLAFSDCQNLTSISIPESVTNIDFGAFSGCTGLTSITCEASTPSTCGDNIFSEVDKSIAVYVPVNSIGAYKVASEWKDFSNILPIPIDPTLTLTDKTPDLIKGYYKNAKVTYTRNDMSVGDYATFCLPFDIDLSKTTDNFSKVYVPLNIGFLKPTGALLLLFDEVNNNSVIKAGQIFVTKCKTTDVVFENYSDITFDDFTPNPTPSNVKVYNFDGISGALTQNTDVNLKIGGTYSNLTKLDKNKYRTLYTNGSFTPTTSVNPFLMYVYMESNGSLGSKITSISIDFNDEATGIKELRMNNDKQSIYNLNGQRINNSNAQKGVYIINGKKYAK